MNFDPGAATYKIFTSIVKGRQAERANAQSAISDSKIDRRLLRILILDALSNKFYPREDQKKDDEVRRDRGWLLSTLGRISDDDPVAKKVVRNHLDPANEPSRWVRFWALESLVAAKALDIQDFAGDTIKREEDPLVRMLAVAILASKDDKESKKEIEENVSKDVIDWDTARALRIVYVPSAIKGLCEYIDKGEVSDSCYESIIALGQVPSDSLYFESASQTLVNFISKNRTYSYRDGMRTEAIKSLGNLKVENAAPLLIEELTDYNPAIVREAARAIEKALGIRIATARILEAAGKAGQDNIEGFVNALRWMDRESIVDELEAFMVSGPLGQQEVARKLLSEIGGSAAYQKLKARTKAMDLYTLVMKESEEKIRNLFESSINEARGGFKLAAIMDTVVFFLGVALIAISAGLVLSNGGTLDNWAGIGLTGGGGVLGIIYGILIAKPRRQVREGVDHLMHLKLIFLAYLRQLNQADQAYTRRLLEDEKLTPQEVHEFSEMVGTTMRVATEQLANNHSMKAITEV